MPKGVYEHKPHSEETKKKIRLNSKIHKGSFKKGHKGYWKGKKMSVQHKAKLKKSSNHLSGFDNPNWKGGIIIGDKGYIWVRKLNHPRVNTKGYIQRSHLVMEKMIGRYLEPEEIVHHKGIHFPIKSIENRQDDSPENLELFATLSKHCKLHFPKGSMFGANSKNI